MYTVEGLKYIDAGLLIWQIAQTIGVLFFGYLIYKGFFALIDERRKAKHLRIDSELDYWAKMVKLIQIKDEYKSLEEYYKHKSKEEVDIKNYDELTDEEKEFLSHNDENPSDQVDENIKKKPGKLLWLKKTKN